MTSRVEQLRVQQNSVNTGNVTEAKTVSYLGKSVNVIDINTPDGLNELQKMIDEGGTKSTKSCIWYALSYAATLITAVAFGIFGKILIPVTGVALFVASALGISVAGTISTVYHSDAWDKHERTNHKLTTIKKVIEEGGAGKEWIESKFGSKIPFDKIETIYDLMKEHDQINNDLEIQKQKNRELEAKIRVESTITQKMVLV